MNNIKNMLFNEREHTYWYEGRQLHGVTRSYGSQVHKEVENWIKGGCPCPKGLQLTDSAKWIASKVDWWRQYLPNARVKAEVRVSDFRATASNVDIAIDYGDNLAVLLTSRLACLTGGGGYYTLQLNAYKRIYELSYGRRVIDMLVLCSRYKRELRIYDSEYLEDRNTFQDISLSFRAEVLIFKNFFLT